MDLSANMCQGVPCSLLSPGAVPTFNSSDWQTICFFVNIIKKKKKKKAALSNIFSPFLLLSLGKNMSYDLRYDPSHVSLSDFEEGIGLVQREHQKVGDIIPMS